MQNRLRDISKIKIYAFGFSRWKHRYIRYYIPDTHKIEFVNPIFSKDHLLEAIERGLDSKSEIYIWGRREFDEVVIYATSYGIPISIVEDGFIRSVGLGSDLTQPYSIVIDSRGIYYDPTSISDLEYILKSHNFSEDELYRAESIQRDIIKYKLSKYNCYSDSSLSLPSDRVVVLVVGQVEDDASILYGAFGMDNLKLLEQTRANRPQAYIVYKPHPDVVAGNRRGHIDEMKALLYCDRVVYDISIATLLGVVDEVHTMTSLVGFEAILRGVEVTTYGMPFYAGWGITNDRLVCDRRDRVLSVDELVAGALILYPRYLDPSTNRPCKVERVISQIIGQRENIANYPIYSVILKWFNIIMRKIRRVFDIIIF